MPQPSDEAELRSAYEELFVDGHSEFLLDGFQENPEDYAGWLVRVHDHVSGQNLAPNSVPATFLLGVVDGSIVGRVSIRHELNDFLANFGGHIGYMVRPKYRRLGYATRMLELALARGKNLGLVKVLLTCDDDNVGSIAVIESQGGVLESTVIHDGKPLRRYWIDLRNL